MTAPTFDPNADDDVETDVAEQPADDSPHEVTTNPADPRQRKVLFSGTFKEALTYLRNNFPRLHVEPGGAGNPVPDALLHAPNGDTFAHHGEGAVGADDNGLIKQEGNEQ